jgi:hypothetical protein
LKHLSTLEPRVEVGARTDADVGFVLIVDNQISGRVLDSAGKPVKDVCVRLNPAAEETSHFFYIADCSKTDGSYRLRDMPSGHYMATAEP